MTSGFCLPPGVHDRAFATADFGVIPHPSFRIDWFTHGSKQTQTAEIVLLQPLIAPFHEGTDGCGSGVKHRHGIFFDDLPEAVIFRPVRCALKHQGSRAHGKRTVNEIAVACDPAHISGAPVNILVTQIEDVFAGHLRVQQIAAGGVKDPLGLARAATRVEDEQGRLGIHRHGRTMSVHIFKFTVPPHIATFLDVDLLAGALVNNHGFHRRVLGFECVIDILLQRHDGTAAEATIGSDDDFGTTVQNAVLDRLRTEPAKDDIVNRTDSGAGQHGDCGLWNHRQINHHAVTFFHLVTLQHIGKAAHLTVELLISQHTFLSRLAFPNQRGLGLARPLQMTIKAVLTHVQFAASEPFCGRTFPVEHFGERLRPMQLLRFTAKELVRVLERFLMHFLVLRHRTDARLSGKLSARLKEAILSHARLVATDGVCCLNGLAGGCLLGLFNRGCGGLLGGGFGGFLLAHDLVDGGRGN